MTLSKDGFALRNGLAKGGIELTPDQLEDGICEADERIQPGPFGVCVVCHRSERNDGSGLDFRYGMCYECAFPDEATPTAGTSVPTEGEGEMLLLWKRRSSNAIFRRLK